MVIAFSGHDGSGKTALCAALSERLRAAGHAVRHRREHEYMFLKPVLILFGKKAYAYRDRFLGRRSADSGKGMVFGRVWPYAVWLNAIFEMAYFRGFAKNDFVLLDRCALDAYLSFEHLGLGSSFMKRLFRRVPRPDLHFVLSASPESAYERKMAEPRRSVRFYADQIRAYETRAGELGLETHWTDIPIERTVEELLAKILERAPHP
jgi:thymidylate kinase